MTTHAKDAVPIIRFRPPEPVAAGVDRELPYVLRGREEEFTNIAYSLFIGLNKMHTLEGPPGTGKTSLIRGLGAYAARLGYTVISTKAAEITTPEKLGDLIWSTITEEPDTPQGAEKAKSRTTSGGAEAIIKGHHERTSGPTTQYKSTATLSKNIQQCLTENSKRTAGLLILIDNAAQWRQYVRDGELTADAASICEICESLNEGVHELDPPVPVRTIVTGTPGTIDTIRALTSNRLSTDANYRLHGVPDIAAQQIILDHLRILDARQRPILPTRPMQLTLLTEIAAACDGNVWHANQTGHRLQQLYFDHPTHPPSATEIRAEAEQARTIVHREISQRIHSNIKKVMAGLAAAAASNCNRLPCEETEQLVAALSSRKKGSTALSQCVQNGLLELMKSDGRYPRHSATGDEQDYYRIPIPCLITWLQQRYNATIKSHRTIIDDHVANMSSVAEWNWCPHPIIMQIPAMPRKSKQNHIRGQAVQLYPPVSGDNKTPRQLLNTRADRNA